MKSTRTESKAVSSFRVLLLMIVFAVTGIIMMPSLNIRYTPEVSVENITVSFKWPGTSERIVETEATSRLEGILSGLRNCTKISSSSSRGKGSIKLTFRKGTDMTAVRFELASRIRNAYHSLPQGVTYPDISLGIRGTKSSPDIIYAFSGYMPSAEIERILTDHIIVPISSIKGVENVTVSGSASYEYEILPDSPTVNSLGISVEEISRAIKAYMAIDELGMTEIRGRNVAVKMKGAPSERLESVPIKTDEGGIILLGAVAGIEKKEAPPSSYYRINGLNTLNLSISIEPGANVLAVSKAIKRSISEIQENIQEDISPTISYDSSEHFSRELNKLILRALLCVLILLLLVLVTYRSLRYLFMISAILAVNLFAAVLVYRICGLSIHIYTLAGITVSLGIIIDSAIVMADHYSKHHNRTVFPALLGATLTTVAALCMLALLPDEDKKNLEDFAKVIIINLSVSLVTAYFFIPSLLDKYALSLSEKPFLEFNRRIALKLKHNYTKYISNGLSKKWLAVLITVAAFGLPLYLLPDSTLEKIPKKLTGILCSSSGLFRQALLKGNYDREPGRNVLYIRAGMSEGASLAQLDEIVRNMENYLRSVEQIESFSTVICDFDDALIQVYIKPEEENGRFPEELKSNVISMARNFGGACWNIYGINESSFSNDIISSYKNYGIILSGYNYDNLLKYAEQVQKRLAEDHRIYGIEYLSEHYGLATNEFNLTYDFGSLAARGINPYSYFSELDSHLSEDVLGSINLDGRIIPLVLRPSDSQDFDLWYLKNSPININGLGIKLDEMGSIEKKRSGMPIKRVNQSYEVILGFDFNGSYELAKKVTDRIISEANAEILPPGYKASTSRWQETKEKTDYIWLILIVTAVIFAICCIIFNSLHIPLAIIYLIPVSFIGVFLTFSLTDFTFDMGCFAAMLMLSELVVNAGIYLANEYTSIRKKSIKNGNTEKNDQIEDYVEAFSNKIRPIMLTVLSSILGLIPFLFDGPSDSFWFPFAVTAIAGLLVSTAALILILPLLMIKKR